MTAEDRELLAHYLECGAESWNRSTEGLWCELQLRLWVEPRLPARRPLRACNVGIGVGAWDDWLGDVLGAEAPLVSVDRDPVACRRFALRQAHERHPHPAEVVCGDVLDGALGDRRFDVITVVGSTLRENGARRGEVERVLAGALDPGGALLLAESLPAGETPPAGADVRRFGDSLLALRVIMQH